jgi:hypothetical protein
MVEAKILQCRDTLLKIGKGIITKGTSPPLIRSRAQARIDGKEEKIFELLLTPSGQQPLAIAQMLLEIAIATLVLMDIARRIRVNAFVVEAGAGRHR